MWWTTKNENAVAGVGNWIFLWFISLSLLKLRK